MSLTKYSESSALCIVLNLDMENQKIIAQQLGQLPPIHKHFFGPWQRCHLEMYLTTKLLFVYHAQQFSKKFYNKPFHRIQNTNLHVLQVFCEKNLLMV